MSQQTILITGANRGIGKGLLAEYLLRPDHTVIAATRDPSSKSSRDLYDLPKTESSQLLLIKIEAASETDADAAVEELQSKYQIKQLNVLIANAGISKYFGLASDTPITEVQEHFTTNAVGPLVLFKAFKPLLEATKGSMFVPISTGLATIGGMGDIPMAVTAYGASKTALNYITRKIHFENEWLTAFVISPGWVQTDMGNAGAAANGMKEAPVSLQDSVRGIVKKIDGASRSETSGKFMSFDETEYPW